MYFKTILKGLFYFYFQDKFTERGRDGERGFLQWLEFADLKPGATDFLEVSCVGTGPKD